MKQLSAATKKQSPHCFTSSNVQVTLLRIKDILVHEEYDPSHTSYLAQKIQEEACFTTPVLVDDENLILLDGHHRFHALSGYFRAAYIPVVLIDYSDDDLVQVSSWRSNVVVDHRVVRQAALSRNLLPKQTSKHTLSFEIGTVDILLPELGIAT